ncbi:hypothetical protein ACU61A_09400 [Pseudonocardia sichuanensis]
MSARRPAFLTSDAVAETLAAALWDYASRLTAEPGHAATTASLVRLARRSARELRALHDIPAGDALIDPPPDNHRQEI